MFTILIGSKMTYGEYYYKMKNDMKLKDGVWIVDRPSGSVPTRMSTKEASKYYTLKFREYWKKVNNA